MRGPARPHPFLCRFLCTILFCTCLSALHAQLPDYHLQLFSQAHGIQPGTIVSVKKDPKGYMWILYRRQLQRFDGKQVIVFRPDNVLEDVFFDSEGRIWVSSVNRAFLYSDTLANFREVPIAGDSATAVSVFMQPAPGRLWLGSSKGLLEYDEKGGLFRPTLRDLPVGNAFRAGEFACISDRLFIQQRGQLIRYNIRNRQIDSLPVGSFAKMYPISADSVVVLTWDNSSRWMDYRNRSTHAISTDGKPVNAGNAMNVRGLTGVGPGEYFFVAREGIFRYSSGSRSFRKLSFFREGRRVYTEDYSNYIHNAGDGYCWLSVMDGVARFPLRQQAMGQVRLEQSMSLLPAGTAAFRLPGQPAEPVWPAQINSIRKVVADQSGNLWMATGHGLAGYIRDTRRWILFPPIPGSTVALAHPSIRGLCYDGRNLVLGPTNLGLWIFNPRTYHWQRPVYKDSTTRNRIMADFVNEIRLLHDGSMLVLSRDGLYRLSQQYELSTIDPLPGARGGYDACIQQADKKIWIATVRNLYLADSNLRNPVPFKLPGSNSYIRSFTLLRDGRLLFSTDGGLFTAALQNGKAEVSKYSDLFDNNTVHTLMEDRNGVIWAGSDQGIGRYDPCSSTLSVFDQTDNVQGYGFNKNSWFRDAGDYVYFGGASGLNYFQPESFSLIEEKLLTYIREVRPGRWGKPVHIFDERLSIEYDERSIEVELVTPYFSNAGKIWYRYRLAGEDPEWKPLGHGNILRFSSLFPGKYTLEVQSSVDQVHWTKARNTLDFRILFPFWMSWWFISLVIIAIGLLLAWFIRNRNRKLARKQEELEAEQAINYFSSGIYETNSVHAILWDVARNCIGRLHFEDCVIYLLDPARQVLVQCAAYGPKSPDRLEISNPIEIQVGQGITGSVAATGKAEIVPDTSRDSRYIVDGAVRLSEIAVPIIAGGRVLGVIDCEHSKKRFFTQKHLSILTTIASLCANKIIKAEAETEKVEAQAKLMSTRKQMADAEMLALRAQMNPHFIFNCLNSINRYIVKSDQATASLYLTRFAKLIRLILDNSNSQSITLANELEALRLYIEMEMIRFETKFTYSIETDADVHPDAVYVPPLMIQPYVENAIWHGLLHKEPAGHLVVSLHRPAPGVLECVIEDNGIGRKKAAELKSKSAGARKSLGMKLTEDRLELLSRQAEQEANVTIHDLVDPAGEAAGTRVVMKIPVDL